MDGNTAHDVGMSQGKLGGMTEMIENPRSGQRVNPVVVLDTAMKMRTKLYFMFRGAGITDFSISGGKGALVPRRSVHIPLVNIVTNETI